jgi:hypothetical protein
MKPSPLLFASLLAWASFLAPAARADEGPTMGMVGITRDQMLRVSLFHDADAAGVICPSIVEIVAANGKILASSTAELAPGTGAFFDYDLTQGLKRRERLQLHVIVRTRPDHPGGATVEVYDRKTGATQAVALPTLILDASLTLQ